MHGLHSLPIKAVLSGHSQNPFSIFPPLQLLIGYLLGKSIDDAYTKNNKNIKLFILYENKIN